MLMNTMKSSLLIFLLVYVSIAQKPISTSEEKSKPTRSAPDVFSAKYEGGVFGYIKKRKGFLLFDSQNQRLVFQDEKKKEIFGLPYTSINLIYPNSKSVISNSGRVVSAVPYFGVLGGLIKEKRKYLIIQFSDPDVKASGTASFKIESQELLDSVLTKLAKEAGLKQRGEAYYRPK